MDRIEVSPLQVRLNGRRDYRQFVVTGYVGAEAHDLTHEALYHISNPKVVRLVGTRIFAVGNGHATVTLSAGSRTVQIPVTVLNWDKPDPIRFKFETVAALTKQGCANGSCHGSPHGKGGFSLSLFGYDPRIDRISLTRDGFNRRVNVMDPVESLMIKKPLLEIPHVGGKRLHKTDAAYDVLTRWIYEGANTDLPNVDCQSISVFPAASRVLRSPNLGQQISVIAAYSDRSTRDVTAIASYESSNPNVAIVDADGWVTGRARGQSAISVRYLDKLQSIYFTVVEDVPGFAWKQPIENNFIDHLVDAKLKQLQFLPSDVCNDTTFLRRLYLDLTGLLPAAATARAFLQDSNPAKRSILVNSLLDSQEYARFWALKKADLMRVSNNRLKDGHAAFFGDWIVDAVAKNMPYDQFARNILTAEGDTLKVAPANYFKAVQTMEERTEMTTEIFMGSRVECAHCHNHPFEKWTMRDYYSIGAVFARTQEQKGVVKLASSGEVMLPKTSEVMSPYGMATAEKESETDRRAAFVDWLTAPDNPLFARVEVNRMWANLFGRGIVNPVDDFRSSNPPSNVPLLDALAVEFRKSGYDSKHMIRLICNSRTYQHAMETNSFNATDETLFSHAGLRLLSAEQLRDAIALTTHVLPPPSAVNSHSTDPHAQAIDRDTRMRYATQRPYPENSQFNTTFGQPERETACTCERLHNPTLLQALELLNGDTAYRMAQSGAHSYMAEDTDRLIEDVYLTALSRFPSPKEQNAAKNFFAKHTDREQAVTDLLWTMVNLQEFLFQH